jgi:hypothetical protein
MFQRVSLRFLAGNHSPELHEENGDPLQSGFMLDQ